MHDTFVKTSKNRENFWFFDDKVIKNASQTSTFNQKPFIDFIHEIWNRCEDPKLNIYAA